MLCKQRTGAMVVWICTKTQSGNCAPVARRPPCGNPDVLISARERPYEVRAGRHRRLLCRDAFRGHGANLWSIH